MTTDDNYLENITLQGGLVRDSKLQSDIADNIEDAVSQQIFGRDTLLEDDTVIAK